MEDNQVLNPANVENPQEKVCYKCRNKKPIEDFNKCKTGVYGFHNQCRLCQKETKAKWYANNKSKVAEYMQRDDVKQIKNKRLKERYDSDPNWREKRLKLNRDRRRGEEAKQKARIQRNKWREKPQNKIACTLRGRLRAAMMGIVKFTTTEKLLGCSFETCRAHLESKFSAGMTWENYGQWHIDHIRPCASFDLTDPEQQRQCFHYTNLQPLWALENIRKGSKAL